MTSSPAPNHSAAYHEVLRRQWFVVCTTADLRKAPVASIVLGHPLVLFGTPTTVTALSDRCPHRNAPLSAGRIINQCLQCPYHGWEFGPDGTCRHRPGISSPGSSPPHADNWPTVVQDGLVWVNLDRETQSQPPRRPWYQDSQLDHFHWHDVVPASLPDALENLLDGTHTPFVHSGLVRSQTQQQHFKAVVRVQDGIAEAEYQGEDRQAGWISRLFERNRRSSFGRFVPPCLAELEYTSDRGTEFVLNSCFTPVSEQQLSVHTTIFLRRSRIPLAVRRLIITPFFRRVLRQDQDILRLQQHNIARFGGPEFHSWDGDLLRGWIDMWLQTGQLPQQSDDQLFHFTL